MRAVVVHHTLNSVGGETTVALETIESLYELGYKVDLITVQKPDLQAISRLYGREIHVNDSSYILPFKLNYFGIYQRLLASTAGLFKNVKDADIVVDTHGGNIFPLSRDIPTITYLHYPAALLNPRRNPQAQSKYQNSLFWQSYFWPYYALNDFVTRKTIGKVDLVLTNSRFSKAAINEAYPFVQPYVLYPPVNIERFSKAFHSGDQGPQVLTISRFSPEKSIEKALQIARIVAKNDHSIKFKIIGSLVPSNKSYFSSLIETIDRYGLKENVQLLPNASNDELIDTLSKSSVYLHTMAGEHFGVSIVEAMASGLVPVVPRYGGCSEIAPQEYQYDTVEEAAVHVQECLRLTNATNMRPRMHERAERFSLASFRNKLGQYVEQARQGKHVEAGSAVA